MSTAVILRRAVALAALVSILAGQPALADLIVDGDFEACESGNMLRRDDKGQDWRESRKDGQEGPKLLKLSTKKIGGNQTHKAMIKGSLDLNTYLTQKLASVQSDPFEVSYDIYVKEILPEDNSSGFCFVGSSSDKKNGPNSTAKERFVFLGFENAETEGKINLFAREGKTSWKDRTIVAGELELKKWYTVELVINPDKRRYEVTVKGMAGPVELEAHALKGKPSKKLSYISFASWNDGAGTFYVDNVAARQR
jgi:hypothetical protein